MKTYKRHIPASKFERIKKDPRSVKVGVDGHLVRATRFGIPNTYLLGDFMYRREVDKLNPRKIVYFRYRVKPVEAYSIDLSYFG